MQGCLIIYHYFIYFFVFIFFYQDVSPVTMIQLWLYGSVITVCFTSLRSVLLLSVLFLIVLLDLLTGTLHLTPPNSTFHPGLRGLCQDLLHPLLTPHGD